MVIFVCRKSSRKFPACTLIKFWRNNKVNLATLAFGATLAQIKRDVKQVEQVYLDQTPRLDSGKPCESSPGFSLLKVQCAICIHTGIYLGQIPWVKPCWFLPRISNGTNSPRLALLYRQNFIRVHAAFQDPNGFINHPFNRSSCCLSWQPFPSFPYWACTALPNRDDFQGQIPIRK